jgi:hypothetical protein
MFPPDPSQLRLSTSLASTEAAVLRIPPAHSARLALLLGAMIVVSLAGLLGGMQYVIIGLAVGLAILVAHRPEEAVPAGLLFMLVAMTLLPSEARLRFIDPRYDQSWQMYYWAAGSLVIVLAALCRVGFSSLWRAPALLKTFLVVAVASAVFGFWRGNDPGYVVRQLYGSILLVLYFVIACAVGDEELLFLRLRTFGVLVSFAFFVYYASVFSEWGFHKEDTSLPIQMGVFAALLFVRGVLEKRLFWIAPSGVLFIASFLLFFRNILLTFLFAAALAFAVGSASRIRKLFFLGVAALILLPSIFPLGAQYVLDMLEKNAPRMYEVLPEGTSSAATLMSRNLQLVLGAAAILKSPVFGEGMGAELAWEDPARGSVEQAYVDNGWAYVMIKMGIAGVIAFGWLLFTMLRCMSRQSSTISISLLAILLIAMFSEPFCFQFTTSPIAGALAGMLYARKHGAQGVCAFSSVPCGDLGAMSS